MRRDLQLSVVCNTKEILDLPFRLWLVLSSNWLINSVIFFLLPVGMKSDSKWQIKNFKIRPTINPGKVHKNTKQG